MTLQTLAATTLFDGAQLLDDMAVMLRDGVIEAIVPRPEGVVPMPGILAPGFVDLQVNGGAGLMVGAGTDAAALARICAVHRDLGCAGILPTLITDGPEVTARVLAAGIAAARVDTPGFLGLHLEGPHLDPRRAGAHDAALIRPMTDADMAVLIAARADLPALMVTLAPEAATPAQIAALTAAGIIVSLGHSDCTLDQAQAAFAAGARCATHLFNAMSPLGHRQPGLVGAVLSGDAQAGIIADGTHVDPAALRIALRARPGGLFLISDCMAVAGTTLTEFPLQGRRILRRDGRLTLADGTLAGADLRLDRAVRVAVAAGADPAQALAMATSVPAGLIGAKAGRIAPGRAADLILLDADLHLTGIRDGAGWRAPRA
ncbi:N-acetylglucosamine-6-phosphate deacetylase [Paracoccus marcusii]|uniref:N-acetylglucosamine-6-phosphate deacetylase n=1 Tax=Paracoccus marcusii TaxID=59779 RepID=A0ABY7UTQ6_9RHOB|nr:N-acetylglucosamine-6-phosphate deacetylase [Paracoccus marcusii]WDA13272.1 N-acetylglucosamine-6-phosphate deacetylase [Paracoccus marcusii]